MSSRQNFVQSLGPERRALRHIGADLLDVFLPALVDLVLEQLRQCAVPNALLPLLRMIDQHVGDEGPREPPRFLFWVLHQERIHRPQWTGAALPRRGYTCTRRTRRSRRNRSDCYGRRWWRGRRRWRGRGRRRRGTREWRCSRRGWRRLWRGRPGRPGRWRGGPRAGAGWGAPTPPPRPRVWESFYCPDAPPLPCVISKPRRACFATTPTQTVTNGTGSPCPRRSLPK